MKFQINAFSPVRAFVQGLRVSSAVYRVAANVGDLIARGAEAVTSEVAIKALAGHLAAATAPLEGVVPEVGDEAARAAKLEIGLRRDIHGDVPVAPVAPVAAAAVPCPGKSRSARRRARARAAKAAEAAAKEPFWTEERQRSFASAFGKA